MARPNIFALTLVGALGTSACMGTVRLEQSLPGTVGQLSTVKTLEVAGEDGVVLLSGTLNDETTAAGNGKITRTVTLTSPTGPAPAGTAEIRIVRENGVSDEQVILKVREMPFPAICRFLADGKELAMFSTSGDGKADLRLTRRVTGSGEK